VSGGISFKDLSCAIRQLSITYPGTQDGIMRRALLTKVGSSHGPTAPTTPRTVQHDVIGSGSSFAQGTPCKKESKMVGKAAAGAQGSLRESLDPKRIQSGWNTVESPL